MPIRFGFGLPGPFYYTPSWRRRRSPGPRRPPSDEEIGFGVFLFLFVVFLVVPVWLFGALGALAWPLAGSFIWRGIKIRRAARQRYVESLFASEQTRSNVTAPSRPHDGWRTYDRSLLDDVT